MNSKSQAANVASSMLPRADELTARCSCEGKTADLPPVITAQSPLHELLIEEIEASLPKPIVLQLRGAKSIARVHDWIAAAAMYTWIKGDESISRRFLDEVAQSPADACIALTKTIARTMKPQPPTNDARYLDKWGLVIQAACAVPLLLMRGAWFEFLAGLVEGSRPTFDFVGIVHSIALPDLVLASSAVTPLITVLLFGCATAWLFLESRFILRFATACRAWPFRHLSNRSQQDWRSDGLAFMWCAHGFFLQAALFVECLSRANDARSRFFHAPITVAVIWLCTAMVAVLTITALLQLVKTSERPE